MARDEDAGHFEWVNAWATTTAVRAAAAPPKDAPVPAPAPQAVPRYTVGAAAEATLAPEIDGAAATASTPAVPADQLMRDIAEIERARDALAGGRFGQQMRAFMLVPSRSADATPLVIGGILALAMLTVFGAAAAVSKFSVR
jgi:hypothetical protein